MGYTTDFNGVFKLNKKLDKATHEFLVKLNETRRMQRDASKLKALTGNDYGIQGEFYVDGYNAFITENCDETVIDHNSPPKTQPSLWCQWRPTNDGKGIEWDQDEKFYEYVAWIEYIVAKVLTPKGYTLTGAVQWRGESFDDIGTIVIRDSKVEVKYGKHVTLSAKTKRIRSGCST